MRHAEVVARSAAGDQKGPAPSLATRLARGLVGYDAAIGLPKPWGLVFTIAAATAAVVIAVMTAFTVSNTDAPPTQADITVLSRLDDHTKQAGPRTANTIPTFLTRPGKVGALEADGRGVTEISELELNKGFCSPTIATLVRQQFPGSYDDWPDDKLEETVLVKHPEYRDRLCVLPVWISASPHDIVKYELRPRAAFALEPRALLWALVAAAGFAVAMANAFYRFLRIPQSEATPALFPDGRQSSR